MTGTIFVFDMDGTLCTNNARTSALAQEVAKCGPMTSWPVSKIIDSMRDVMSDDQTPLVRVASRLDDIYVVTARPGSCYIQTVAWLQQHKIKATVLMREHPHEWAEDGRAWKLRTLRRLASDNRGKTVVHFDDDAALISELHLAGISGVLCPWSQHV